MTLHDQQQAAADVQGMIEAEYRHGGGMSQVEVADQYRAIQARPIGQVNPYEAKEEEAADTGQLKPAQIRSLKIFTVSGSVVCAWVGFLQVCASGAMNTVFQYAAGAGVVVFALSGLFGGSGSSSENPTYSNRRGGDTHNHYYQNNSFGGSANQTNQ
jgi:hypothetical protein